MVWILNGILNTEAQPIEVWTNGCQFVKNHLKSGQKCTNFEWSGFRKVGTIAIIKLPFECRASEYRTSKSVLLCKKFSTCVCVWGSIKLVRTRCPVSGSVSWFNWTRGLCWFSESHRAVSLKNEKIDMCEFDCQKFRLHKKRCSKNLKFSAYNQFLF